MPKNISIRGIRGAASWCSIAAIFFLLIRLVLQALLSGALTSAGADGSAMSLFYALLATAAAALSILWLLKVTRLTTADLRILIPGEWSPLFITLLFLGCTNAANMFCSLFSMLFHAESGTSTLPSGGLALFVSFVALCVLPPITEELFFRGAMQGIVRPCGSPAAIFVPALLFALLHFNLMKGVTAFISGLFLGWLVERTGSILPSILLHFVNNCIAFLDLYLTQYASEAAATAVTLFILIFFPLAALFALWRAMEQGFRFTDGLHAGSDPLSAFSSPAYLLTVAFLVVFALFFV